MEPLRANSWAEAHLYLRVTPCLACGKGPWEVDRASSSPGEARSPGTVMARCRQCRARQEFVFRCPPDAPEDGDAEADSPAPWLNPTPQPSTLIDLGQWLGLFYMMVESAGKADRPNEARRLTFQAAQCLDEALKFYGPEDELPPSSTLFTESSRQAFADHPEKFARQRLFDLRAKLPGRGPMARRLQRNPAPQEPQKWWRFWRK